MSLTIYKTTTITRDDMAIIMACLIVMFNPKNFDLIEVVGTHVEVDLKIPFTESEEYDLCSTLNGYTGKEFSSFLSVAA